MSAATDGRLHKLFDLQLGSRFRYAGQTSRRVFVLLDRGGCGTVTDAPTGAEQRTGQGIYSAADSADKFRGLLVEFVPVKEVPPTLRRAERTQRAIELLKQGFSTADIARLLCFYDVKSLTHAIQRATGKTPSQLREEWRTLDKT